MFGNARSEFAASPLSAHDGVLYGAANLGVCYAIEMATGRMRWISAYEVVRMPQTQLHNQMDRPVYFANSAPAVRAGVLCCTPLDSQYALGIDTEVSFGPRRHGAMTHVYYTTLRDGHFVHITSWDSWKKR